MPRSLVCSLATSEIVDSDLSSPLDLRGFFDLFESGFQLEGKYIQSLQLALVDRLFEE